MHNLTSTNNFRVHNVLEYGRTSVSMIQGRLGGVCSKHPIFTVILLNLLMYMLLAAGLRYIAIHYVICTETEHRFLSTHRDSEEMAVGQAQLMKRNGTKLEVHGLFGYSYTVELFKVGRTASNISSTSHLNVRINNQAQLHGVDILCSK